MHGLGNDYVVINCLDLPLDAPSDVARAMCKRRTSVGADGLVMICPSSIADAKMRMFNPDGSEAGMCGNAIRCVGKYLYDNGITNKTELGIETQSGVKKLSLALVEEKVSSVTVDMGRALTDPCAIPLLADEPMINTALLVDGVYISLTCLSMGNPHAVAFVNDVDSIDLPRVGPAIENHRMFPERVNAEFVKIIDRTTLAMRVWERGCGETLACGTGACASAAAAVICGFCRSETDIKVILPGGELTVFVMPDMSIRMSGGCVKVFDGVFDTAL